MESKKASGFKIGDGWLFIPNNLTLYKVVGDEKKTFEEALIIKRVNGVYEKEYKTEVPLRVIKVLDKWIGEH